MSAVTLIGSVVLVGVAVVQSTLLDFLRIAGAQPDLVIVVLVFIANRNGVMTGQVCGFAAGLTLDLMGLSPLGFYALVYTVTGALFGITRGKMFVDPIFMPLLLGAAAIILKGVVAVLISLVFGLGSVRAAVFSGSYLMEIGYTAVAAPILYALLGMAPWLHPDRRKGMYVG